MPIVNDSGAEKAPSREVAAKASVKAERSAKDAEKTLLEKRVKELEDEAAKNLRDELARLWPEA